MMQKFYLQFRLLYYICRILTKCSAATHQNSEKMRPWYMLRNQHNTQSTELVTALSMCLCTGRYNSRLIWEAYFIVLVQRNGSIVNSFVSGYVCLCSILIPSTAIESVILHFYKFNLVLYCQVVGPLPISLILWLIDIWVLSIVWQS